MRFWSVVILLACPLAIWDSFQSAHTSPVSRWSVIALFCCAGPFIVLKIFVSRIEADDNGLAFFDMLNRVHRRIEYSALTRYVERGAAWWLEAGELKVSVRQFATDPLHGLIVLKAPGTLAAKRWSCNQIPPTEQFCDLPTFDVALWAWSTAGAATAVLLMFLVFHRFPVGFLAYGVPAWPPLLYDLKNLVRYLSITSEGLTERWPWSERFIAWDEVAAVYFERNMGRNCFLVVGPGKSIRIPPRVSRNLEPMRKFFYNLPQGTLMVNFDSRWNRGYRVRRKRLFGRTDAVGEAFPSF